VAESLENSAQGLNFTGQMLIAMPGMMDPRFAHSTVLLCAHSEDGAMGLIVNKTMGGMKFSDMLEQLSIDESADSRKMPLHFGGPVEGGRGFVLHSAEYRSDISTLPVSDLFAMTATLDILEDMAVGGGPDQALMALGYSGWGPGQLESEIAENGWLVCDASLELVFQPDNDTKWEAALNSLGIDPLTLSASAGHA
jgi:putative transcriptional regulator